MRKIERRNQVWDCRINANPVEKERRIAQEGEKASTPTDTTQTRPVFRDLNFMFDSVRARLSRAKPASRGFHRKTRKSVDPYARDRIWNHDPETIQRERRCQRRCYDVSRPETLETSSRDFRLVLVV